MTATRNDIWKLIGYLQEDLRVSQQRLVELRSMLAAMSLPDAKEPTRCPHCQVTLAGPRTLTDHIHTSHPEHEQTIA